MSSLTHDFWRVSVHYLWRIGKPWHLTPLINNDENPTYHSIEALQEQDQFPGTTARCLAPRSGDSSRAWFAPQHSPRMGTSACKSSKINNLIDGSTAPDSPSYKWCMLPRLSCADDTVHALPLLGYYSPLPLVTPW
ncbi:MAG: hypothetical protein ACE5OZ_07210 [Candidatus Heimdallarchaeota archaeon]